MPREALHAVLDHVAIAVASWEAAEARWRDRLGGGRVSFGDDGVFCARQLRFDGGGKLELLTPSPEDASEANFVRRFLARYGTAVHHLTLKVPDLHEALDVLRAGGLEPVDVQDTDPWWQEAFLRPSQIGGLVVQVAHARGSDAEWAERIGHTPEPPREGAARFLGLRLRHPDLDRARALWSLLGAEVDGEDVLRLRWPDSPLVVEVAPGQPLGPEVLRFTGTPSLPLDPALGPALEGDAA